MMLSALLTVRESQAREGRSFPKTAMESRAGSQQQCLRSLSSWSVTLCSVPLALQPVKREGTGTRVTLGTAAPTPISMIAESCPLASSNNAEIVFPLLYSSFLDFVSLKWEFNNYLYMFFKCLLSPLHCMSHEHSFFLCTPGNCTILGT